MAGGVIAATSLTRNAGTLFSSTAVVTTAGTATYIDVDTMDGGKLILLVTQSAGGSTSCDITITDGAEYTAGAVGNITLQSTAAAEYIFGPFETSRVKDSNGRINLIKSSVDTCVMSARAILLP